MKRTTIVTVALAPLLALAGAGCGSSNKNDVKASSSPAPKPAPQASAAKAGALSLSADPQQLAFDKKALSAKAGKVTITMKNPSSIPHAIAIEGKGVDKDGNTVQKGGTSTVSVSLKPGTYDFYCPVDGHKQAGMEGKLTVR